ncbi:nitroreductase family protein [Adhaeribacter sp. BT258]|uniref:Nitroreductase family protein n=1 Tax=Adhaeribacter terrigena TaxID=2793070 RepID=A0ABS1BZA9_9BACT|nr:nitroreductase family protein [Adhaeribacter terrigena]MBK0402467.1 nitroreductase family protein [Adhaeribacter terrigena]
MNVIESLNWRYACKRMTGAKVPPEKIDTILEAMRLSASSMGLQPYTILVISNDNLKQELFEKAIKQPQIKEASHVVIFAAWAKISEAQISEYINHVAEERGVNPETLVDFKSNIVNLVKSRSDEANFNWAARQAYIALGTGLVAAAAEAVDATPMEGFNPADVDAVLGLAEMNLRTVVAMPLGYRDEANDFLAKVKKVRRQKEKLFIQLD